MAFENKFHLIEAVVPKGWTIERVAHNKKKYILTDSDGMVHYVRIKGNTEFVVNVFKTQPIESILQKFHTASIAPRSSAKSKTAKAAKRTAKVIDGEEKVKKLSRKAQRLLEKEQAALLEEKQAEIVAVTLKLMDMSLERGSKKHKELREQLHRLDSEAKAIDGYSDFYTRQTELTKDDIRAMAQEGERKKKEKRERKGRKPRDVKKA